MNTCFYLTNLEFEGSKFQHKLQCEEYSENDVEAVQNPGVGVGLVIELEGQGQSVEHDRHKHRVLADGGRGKSPQFVL